MTPRLHNQRLLLSYANISLTVLTIGLTHRDSSGEFKSAGVKGVGNSPLSERESPCEVKI